MISNSNIKLGNVEATRRFIKEFQGIAKVMMEKSHLKPISGHVSKQKKGYILHASDREICVVDAQTFVDALQKTQKLMRTSWFEK